jgi:hypothetical protein
MSETGLAAALKTKDVIDIPKMIENATHIVWFAGYSNRLTFETVANRNALALALGRGVDFRAILCDPESPIASIRAAEPIYANKEELIYNIKSSLSFARTFLDDVYFPMPPDGRGSFGVRLTTSIPNCSCFFIDQLCFASFYTGRMSGNLAPSFIFRAAGVSRIGFYEILKEEFLQTYANAVDPFGVTVSI